MAATTTTNVAMEIPAMAPAGRPPNQPTNPLCLLPSLLSSHVLAPLDEDLPAGQEMHNVAFGDEYIPALQGVQIEAPEDADVEPGAHTVQLRAPRVEEKLPAAHGMHFVASEEE